MTDLTLYEKKEIEAIAEATGYDSEDVMTIFEDQAFSFYPDMTAADLAEELVSDGMFGTVSDMLMPYIDYDAIARDLKLEGYIEVTNGVIVID